MAADAGPAAAERYVPHAADAVLLEQVWREGELVTHGSALTRPGTPFCADPHGWPAWLLIEVMAQVVAASAGLREYRPGLRPRLGLLLGVRAFTAASDSVAFGMRLAIAITESTRDEFGMGVFDCEVRVAGVRMASAILSVYLPDDVDGYLESLES